jgi:integrase
VIIAMSRPWRNPATGVLYFRGRLPADLKGTVAGQTVTVDVAGEPSTVKLAPIFKVSLRTKDAGQARLRHASVQAQLEQRWAVARTGAVSLSHQDIHALAGIWYRDLVATNEAEPGEAETWSIYQDLLGEGLVYFDPDGDGVEREPYDPQEGARTLSRYFNLDAFLEAQGLNVDEPSRTKLTGKIAAALVLGAETLKRRADGDYGADKTAKRFPVWRPERTRPASDSTTLTSLFEGWAKESNSARSTVDQWRSYVARFIEYLGCDDALSVQRRDVVRWKQHLAELGNSPKTINDSKLAALKAAFRWGVDNDLVPANPAAGVSVRHRKRAGEKMLGFEKGEAAIILRAAAQARDPVHRWVPLLCAQSGARVAEVCQLRREDVRSEDGIPYVHFRPEAGGLKNPTSERKVPLHPHVIEAGFVSFAENSGPGPLFYDPKRPRRGGKRPPPKIVAKHVARWVHTLGIEVGRRHRKDPNHAWRHLFRTLARDAGIAESVMDSIQGHAAATVGQNYGETLLSTAARAIARIPLPGIWEPAGRRILSPEQSA